LTRARIRRRLLRGRHDHSEEFDYSEGYEILRRTDQEEFVVRDASGNVTVFDAGGLYADIEIRCEICGAWGEHVTPSREDQSRWVCHGGASPCRAP
jgi:hypothetical protein